MNLRVGEPEELQRRRACKRVCSLEKYVVVLHGTAGRYCNTMKTETMQFLETSGTTCLTTRRHARETSLQTFRVLLFLMSGCCGTVPAMGDR